MFALRAQINSKGMYMKKKSGKVLKIEVRLTTTLFTASILTNEYYRHNRYLDTCGSNE